MGRLHLKLPKIRRPKIRRPRVSRLARSRFGIWTGGGLISAGVGLQWGLSIALIVAGVLLVAYCLLIADVAEPGDGRGGAW
ncbi:hypothetical protein ABT124_17985 [Streptomyces sp. NPDC001982]|uniref:hypothetical protein n=1 Tax=Streptomyces sp. NPDC001982 TaxID=3154405 RepID=UPI00331B8D72